eukprot:1161908-Pyramimonas_sp.AAC.1
MEASPDAEWPGLPEGSPAIPRRIEWGDARGSRALPTWLLSGRLSGSGATRPPLTKAIVFTSCCGAASMPSSARIGIARAVVPRSCSAAAHPIMHCRSSRGCSRPRLSASARPGDATANLSP